MKAIDIISQLTDLEITFNQNNEVLLSKDKLELILNRLRSVDVIFNGEELPANCFVLVDKKSNEFYPFLPEELNEWDNDGSCEKGDKLFKMELIKVY